MIRGLYTAASGMNAEMLRQDVIANNMANVSTAGFKKDDAVFEAFPNRLLKRIHDRLDQPQTPGSTPAAAIFTQSRTLGFAGQGVKPVATMTNFTDGSVVRTDRPLDLALQGNGLFTISRGDGSLAYTRDGSFTIDAEKHLVTMQGDLVVGTNGQAITLDGTNVVVDQAGGVKVDGVDVGQLQFAAYDPARFNKLGANLYTKTEDLLEGLGEEPKANVRVQQGFTEQANVSVVQEMVRMIGVMRAYESNQKTIQMQDETVSKLISDVGHPVV